MRSEQCGISRYGPYLTSILCFMAASVHPFAALRVQADQGAQWPWRSRRNGSPYHEVPGQAVKPCNAIALIGTGNRSANSELAAPAN